MWAAEPRLTMQGTAPSGFVFNEANAATQDHHGDPVENFAVRVVGGTADVHRAEPGDMVTATAGTVIGETFIRWHAVGLMLTETQMASPVVTFVMPASDITLTALFTGDSEITIDDPETDDEVELPFDALGTITTDDFGRAELTVRQGANTDTVVLSGADLAFMQGPWEDVPGDFNANNGGGIGTNRPGIDFPTAAQIDSEIAVVEFDFVGTHTGTNSNVVIGITYAGANPSTFPAIPYIVRLNGMHFDVHNGADFAYLNRVNYVPNLTFTFRFEIDVVAGRYSVWARPEGGEQVLLAADHNFRTTRPASIGRILMHNNTGGLAGNLYTISDIRTSQMQLEGWNYEITAAEFPFLTPGPDRVILETALFNSAGVLVSMDDVSVILPASADASLSSLEITGQTLTPAFDPDVFAYTLAVPNSVTSVTLTAEATHSAATVEITDATGAVVTNPANLVVGDNVFTITVRAEDGTVETYTITVTRAAATGGGGGGGGGGGPLPTPTPPASPDYELHPAYMFGDGAGNFRPSANVTRAEVAAVLARTQLLEFESGIDTLPPGMTSFDAFADVPTNHWAYYYIAWAYDAGLVLGSGGNFRPNASVTREELAAMLARTTTVRPAGTMPFHDAGTISNWARAYVYTVYRENLMVGDAQGNFRPGANITRAEVATAINRVLGRIDSRAALYAADVEHLNRARVFPDVSETAWYFPSVVAAANDHRLTRDDDGIIDWKYIER